MGWFFGPLAVLFGLGVVALLVLGLLQLGWWAPIGLAFPLLIFLGALRYR